VPDSVTVAARSKVIANPGAAPDSQNDSLLYKNSGNRSDVQCL